MYRLHRFFTTLPALGNPPHFASELLIRTALHLNCSSSGMITPYAELSHSLIPIPIDAVAEPIAGRRSTLDIVARTLYRLVHSDVGSCTSVPATLLLRTVSNLTCHRSSVVDTCF